jgi:hypothetical protein
VDDRGAAFERSGHVTTFLDIARPAIDTRCGKFFRSVALERNGLVSGGG